MQEMIDSCVIQEEEIEKIEAIKARIKQNGVECDFNRHDDHALKRFLRARNGDVDKAYNMLIAALEWRKKNNIDTILETGEKDNPNIVLIRDYWPGRIHKTDKEGFPVYYERVGPADVRGLLQRIPVKDMLHYHAYKTEEAIQLMVKLSEENGKKIDQIVMVEDFGGLTWRQASPAALDAFKQVMFIGENYYPEFLRKYYILNPPKILPILYSMLSRFVDPKTLAKVVILPNNKEEAERILLDALGEDNMPAEFGGKCECEGGCIPPGGPFSDEREDGTTVNPVNVTVLRKSVHEVTVVVEEEGSVLEWEFQTKKYDIGFGVSFFEGDETEKEQIIGVVRYECCKDKERGKHKAGKSGRYVFTWDNTYSTLRKKELTYKVTIAQEVTTASHE